MLRTYYAAQTINSSVVTLGVLREHLFLRQVL